MRAYARRGATGRRTRVRRAGSGSRAWQRERGRRARHTEGLVRVTLRTLLLLFFFFDASSSAYTFVATTTGAPPPCANIFFTAEQANECQRFVWRAHAHQKRGTGQVVQAGHRPRWLGGTVTLRRRQRAPAPRWRRAARSPPTKMVSEGAQDSMPTAPQRTLPQMVVASASL